MSGISGDFTRTLKKHIYNLLSSEMWKYSVTINLYWVKPHIAYGFMGEKQVHNHKQTLVLKHWANSFVFWWASQPHRAASVVIDFGLFSVYTVITLEKDRQWLKLFSSCPHAFFFLPHPKKLKSLFYPVLVSSCLHFRTSRTETKKHAAGAFCLMCLMWRNIALSYDFTPQCVKYKKLNTVIWM